METIFYLVGIFLCLFGATVSIVFWLPKPFNKQRLKELLGPKYPIVFVIYFANGPLLIFLGLFLIFKFT